MFILRLIKAVHRPLFVFGLWCICIVVISVRGGEHNEIRVESLGLERSQRLSPLSLSEEQNHQHQDQAQSGPSGVMPRIEEIEDEDNASLPSNRKSSLSTSNSDSSSDVDGSDLELEETSPHGKPTKSTTTTFPQLPFCNSKNKNSANAAAAGLNEDKSVESNKGTDSENITEVDETKGSSEEHEKLMPFITRPPANLGTGDSAVQPERLFLVATLDGTVTLLNQAGVSVWTVPTGELFSSTISSLQLSENGKFINMIPSLTGGLYKYDGRSLLPMPVNADSLLEKSFKVSNDVVMTGGKEIRTIGVDVKTGNVRYECGISGCITPSKTEVGTGSGSESDTSQVTLVIKKQLQTVRAIDSMSGAEKWNFSVGTHELALAGITEGCYEGEQKEGGVLDYVKVVIPEGRIVGADAKTHAVWDKKFDSPIAQAWVLEDGQLISIDPIQNTPIMDDPPALYVGLHNQQFYVQESRATSEKLAHALTDPTRAPNQSRESLAIGWTPAPHILDADETAITSVAHPRPTFRPFFVFERDQIPTPEIEKPAEENPSSNVNEVEETEEFKFPEFDEEDGPIEIINQVIIASLWYWWKEVLGISLFTAVLLNIILMKPIIRAVRMQTVRDMLRYFQIWKNREQEERPLLPINQAQIVEYRFDNQSVQNGRHRTVSNSSQYVESPEQEIPFLSQYLREFDPIQCLGKGGFGVVFEAKKKIDDRSYAVKRIALPNREKARVRVMREVKALAQLDHRNIVRYFNAWIERPPNGWLEKNDPLWNAINIGSPSPTYEYPSDLINPSVSCVTSESYSLAFIQKKKPDHSKISFPNTPSFEDPTNNEDSFIVFETSKTTSTDCFSQGDFQRRNDSLIIPFSANDDTSSSASSDNGFWKRPTSLDIPFISKSNNNSKSLSNMNSTAEVQEPDGSVDDCDGIEIGKEACEIEGSPTTTVMYLYIQQELCQKRTLQDWLRAEKNRNVKTVISLFSQIVEAVEYVHSKKLIHRDLKPSNIFLAGNLDSGEEIIVKIGDFGLATTALAELEAEQQNGVIATPDSDAPIKVNLTGQVGTHLYMSPEQLKRRPYDYKVDIYSLGLIFFELLVPFSTEMERYDVISRVKKLQFPSDFLKSFADEHTLIQDMISQNPNNRPDATAINFWVKSHLQRVSSPDSESPLYSPYEVNVKTIRSQSSPSHMNTSGLERMPTLDDQIAAGDIIPRRKFFKTHSTTTM